MKKTILAIALTLATTSATFAADFVNVTKITVNADKTTTVNVERAYTDGSGRENVISSFWYTFKDTLSAQEAVNKVSLLADGNITVKTNLASTTPKQGQISVLATARMNAWYKGLNNYYIELAKQIANEGLI